MKRRRIIPSRQLMNCSLVVGAVALFFQFLDIEFPNELVASGVIVFLVVLILDLNNLIKAPAITVQRYLPNNLALNRWSEIELTVICKWGEELEIDLFDGIDSTMEVPQFPLRISLQPDSRVTAIYRLKPCVRGPLTISSSLLRFGSRWKFWDGIFEVENPSHSKVFPDFSAISQYVLMNASNRSEQLGIKKRQRRGEGTEFNSLREYRQGDSLRQINWKATSRLQKLISQDYHYESDQQIMVMLDAGRRMSTKDEGISHFDQALNALILTCYISLRMGDAFGVMSFGNSSRWVAAQKGSSQTTSVLKSLYDIQAGQQIADYEKAALDFMKRQQKRCLIIMITNLRDEDTEDLVVALKLLRERHMVLVANIQEEILGQTIREDVVSLESAIRYCGVHNYLASCGTTQKVLSSKGILNFTCTSRELPSTLASSYLEVKSSGTL